MELRSHIDRFLTPRVVLLLGWISFVLYAYPGFMSADSVSQLNQARGIEPVTDWHPPMMTLIWHHADKLLAGPFPMLAIQSIAFLLGVYWVMTRVVSRRAAAITAVVFLLWPGNIIVMAVIWKDSLMAGFLIAGVAGLLADRLRWRLLGCLFVFLATGVRYNAPAATLPLVVLLWDRDLSKFWLKRYAVAAAVWFGITAAAFLANSALVDEGAQPWEIGSATVDIAGILHFAPEIDVEQLARETPDVPWSHKDLRDAVKHYKPQNSFQQVVNSDFRLFDKPTNSAQADALGALFKRLVREHRDAFLRHRLAVSAAQLNCAVSVWHAYTMQTVWAEEQTHHRGSDSRLQHYWIAAMVQVVRLRMFRPRSFFILAFILLPFARKNRLVVALLVSGILNELGLFAFAPSIAYRYSHWMVVCVLLGIILLVIERSRVQARVESTA